MKELKEQLYNQLRYRTDKQIYEPTWKQVKNQVRIRIMEQVFEHIYDEMCRNVRGRTTIHCRSNQRKVSMIDLESTGDIQVRNQIGSPVIEQVRKQIISQIFRKIHDQTRGQIYNLVNNQVENHIRSHVWTTIKKQSSRKLFMNNINLEVNKSIWEKIDVILYTHVFDQVNDQVTMNVYDQTYEYFDQPQWQDIPISIREQVKMHLKEIANE